MSKVIVSYVSFTDEQKNRLEEVAPNYKIVSSTQDVENSEDIEIIYGWDKEEAPKLIEKDASNVKWIQIDSAGVDYLDLDELENKGIVLTNASGIHAHPIAESVFGMLLSYTRGIGHSIKMQSQSKWNSENDNMKELTDKTMTIVGTGKIGKQAGKLAKAFGMHTIGVNRSGRDVDYMDEQFVQKDLAEAVSKADVVIDILPMTDQTEKLFDLKLFENMKETAIFINVGRGQTVVTDDLLTALDKGLIEHAALDVVHEEPLPEDHPIYKRDDVLLTPHISGDFDNYHTALFPIFEKNLKAYVANDSLPENVVDYKTGY